MKTYQYKLDKYLITYPSHMIMESFNEKWLYGIRFQVGKIQYEILHNFAMDTQRLLIKEEAGSGAPGWQDIPFKAETFRFLPEGVSVEEV
jgi:hypothetical protein